MAADALPWAGCAEGGSILWKVGDFPQYCGWYGNFGPGRVTIGNYKKTLSIMGLQRDVYHLTGAGFPPSTVSSPFFTRKNTSKDGWFTRNTMMILGFRPRSHIFDQSQWSRLDILQCRVVSYWWITTVVSHLYVMVFTYIYTQSYIYIHIICIYIYNIYIYIYIIYIAYPHYCWFRFRFGFLHPTSQRYIHHRSQLRQLRDTDTGCCCPLDVDFLYM